MRRCSTPKYEQTVKDLLCHKILQRERQKGENKGKEPYRNEGKDVPSGDL